MTVIKFSMSKSQNAVVPYLDKAVDSLNVVINKCSQLYVPYNFRYRTYVYNLKDNNQTIRNKVVSKRDLIYKVNRTYNNLIQEVKESSANLDSIKIGRKYGSIK